MAGSKSIKQLLIERKMTVKSLAEMLGIEPQSMRNKLYRDTFSYAEIIKIADILNADVQIITRDTHKVFERPGRDTPALFVSWWYSCPLRPRCGLKIPCAGCLCGQVWPFLLPLCWPLSVPRLQYGAV